MSDSPPSPAGDCTVVIFGATGDLARRKLLPALVNLAGRGALPERFAVLGVGRTPMTDEAYREKIASSFSELGSGAADPALWAWLEPRLFYAFETLDTIGELRVPQRSARRARWRRQAVTPAACSISRRLRTRWPTSSCVWALSDC